MEEVIACICGFLFGCLVASPGHNPLGIFMVKCRRSHWTKWLVWNVWGNDNWYLDSIERKWMPNYEGKPQPAEDKTL